MRDSFEKGHLTSSSIGTCRWTVDDDVDDEDRGEIHPSSVVICSVLGAQYRSGTVNQNLRGGEERPTMPSATIAGFKQKLGFTILLHALLLVVCGESLSPRHYGGFVALNSHNSTEASWHNSLHLVASSERDASSRLSMGAQSQGELRFTLGRRIKQFFSFPFRHVGRLFRRPNAAVASSSTNTLFGIKTFATPRAGASIKTKKVPISHSTDTSSSSLSPESVVSDRSATGKIDLSGSWDLVVTDEFKQEYDKYLESMGQPFFIRSVAVNIITMTTEETEQSDDGRTLFIRGKNVKGVWERTLVSSGPTSESETDFEPILTPIKTADDEVRRCRRAYVCG